VEEEVHLELHTVEVQLQEEVALKVEVILEVLVDTDKILFKPTFCWYIQKIDYKSKIKNIMIIKII